MFASLTLAIVVSQSALKIEDVKLGTGEGVKLYDVVEAEYTGKLTNGIVFDSNVKSEKKLRFQVGVGRVIKGWDQGFMGMKLNGERNLTVPPDLGYGERGSGSTIPSNSTLNFSIKLVRILPSAKITMVTEGKGEPIKLGQFLECKLSVKAANGREMADPAKESRLRLSPQMLPWINQAIGGIKAGEKRKVIINSEIAFGEKGLPATDQPGKKAGSDVPPNSDLNMEVEALKITD